MPNLGLTMKLDQFLENFPDHPSVSGLTQGACTAQAVASNSNVDQVKKVPGATTLTGGGLDMSSHVCAFSSM